MTGQLQDEYSYLDAALDTNRRICSVLLGALEEDIAALRNTVPVEAGGDALTLPQSALFAGREGVVGQYAKLSQQHIRLVTLEMKLLAERRRARQETPDTGEVTDVAALSQEDVTALRALLATLEESRCPESTHCTST